MGPRFAWLALFRDDSKSHRRAYVRAHAILALVVTFMVLPFILTASKVVRGLLPAWVLFIEGLFVSGCLVAIWLGLGLSRSARRYGAGVLCALILLAIARAILYNAMVGFVYLAVVAGLVLSIRRALIGVALMSIGQIAVWIALNQQPWVKMIDLAFQAMLLGFATIGLRRLIDVTHELARTRTELARRAVDEQRLRFAEELNSLGGSRLSLIASRSQDAGRLVDGTARNSGGNQIVREMNDIEEIARQALVRIDETSASSYPLSDLDLAKELDAASDLLRSFHIAESFRIDGVQLTAEQSALFGHVVREAVANVLRHSGATHCAIEVLRVDGSLRLRVVDDGVGLRPPGKISGKTAGWGLIGLKERMEAAGGTLETSSNGHPGFQLEATLPSVSQTTRERLISSLMGHGSDGLH